jgi:hypothetical protein
MASQKKTKKKTLTKTERDAAAAADALAALTVAASHGARGQWESCRVHLRQAIVIAPNDGLREALVGLFDYVIGRKK